MSGQAAIEQATPTAGRRTGRGAVRRLAALGAVIGAAAVVAVAARAGLHEADAHQQRATPPATTWVAPVEAVPPVVTTAPPIAVVLPTLPPATAPFSSYFDGTMRVRNIQGGSLGVGTAFAVGDGTWALTNRHVVQGARSLELESWDGQPIGSATVVALGPATTDLALLKLPRAVDGALHLATQPTAVDTELVAGGYPEAHHFTRSVGRLLAVTAQDGMNMLVTDVPAAPGSSGSPLLDPSGTVVGVIFGGSYSGYTLAVPAADAVALLVDQQVAP
ncbi:MAG: serine protease [Acidimicrobiales bacterium]